MPPSKKKSGKAPEATVHTMTDLEQVRILADPLRMRILEALCGEPRTTKQVADQFGEKPTKLYHHVEALQRVGLIQLVKTLPKRGTLEKYYQAVARSFRADPRLFAAEPSEVSKGIQEAVVQIFDKTLKEISYLASGEEEVAEDALIVHLRVSADPQQIKAIGEKLQSVVTLIQEENDAQEPSERRQYGLTIAYYPIREERRQEAGGRRQEEKT